MPEVRIEPVGGEVSDVNPVNIPHGYAQTARNVYAPAAGAVSKRPGFVRHVQSQYTGAVSMLAQIDDVTIVVAQSINDA